MKPLHKKELQEFLKRFNNFEDAEFRSINIISPRQIKVLFAVQDNAREFNWITVGLEFSGIEDARLIESSRLPLIDMSEGVNIIAEDGLFAFSLGRNYNKSNIVNSLCYIISQDLKYEEGLF